MSWQKSHKIAAAAVLITAALIISGVSALTAQEAETASEEYSLNVTTDPPEVRETEADFSATVDELDDNFDAALVYWNYSQDQSLDQKGPANIAFEEGETVESLQSGLEAQTGYNVEAYVEPVVCEDETLLDNFVEKGIADQERNRTVLDSDVFWDNDTAIRNVFESNVFWSSELATENIWERGSPEPREELVEEDEDPGDAQAFVDTFSTEEGGKGLRLEMDGENDNGVFPYDWLEVDLSNQDELVFDRFMEEQGKSRFNSGFKVIVDGSTVYEETGPDEGETFDWEEITVDVSDVEGEALIQFAAWDDGTSEVWTYIKNVRFE